MRPRAATAPLHRSGGCMASGARRAKRLQACGRLEAGVGRRSLAPGQGSWSGLQHTHRPPAVAPHSTCILFGLKLKHPHPGRRYRLKLSSRRLARLGGLRECGSGGRVALAAGACRRPVPSAADRSGRRGAMEAATHLRRRMPCSRCMSHACTHGMRPIPCRHLRRRLARRNLPCGCVSEALPAAAPFEPLQCRCPCQRSAPYPPPPHPDSWSAQETKEMVYAMRARVPPTPADLANLKAWRAPASPFVLDIGANVGWFTLNAAIAGGTVAAFEGGFGEGLGGELRQPWLLRRWGGRASGLRQVALLPLCLAGYGQASAPTTQPARAGNMLHARAANAPRHQGRLDLLTARCRSLLQHARSHEQQRAPRAVVPLRQPRHHEPGRALRHRPRHQVRPARAIVQQSGVALQAGLLCGAKPVRSLLDHCGPHSWQQLRMTCRYATTHACPQAVAVPNHQRDGEPGRRPHPLRRRERDPRHATAWAARAGW